MSLPLSKAIPKACIRCAWVCAGCARRCRCFPVFCAMRKRQRARWDGVPLLSHDLAEKREAALARAQDAAKSARFRTLTVEVAAWLEAGRWTKPQDELIRDRGNLS